MTFLKQRITNHSFRISMRNKNDKKEDPVRENDN